MSNHLKNFGDRVNDPQANVGETKAEEYYKSRDFEGFRFGCDLLQEDIDVSIWCKIPILIRKKPDYIVVKKNAYFIEAKGCINIVRLKEEFTELYKYMKELRDKESRVEANKEAKPKAGKKEKASAKKA